MSTLTSAMPPVASLEQARRFAWPAVKPSSVTAAECVILLAAGAASAAISLTIGGFRVPGSTVLQAVLPMAAGLAMVPRRGSGLVMGSTALACGTAMAGFSAWGIPHVNPSELARLFLLGVCLEVGPARARDSRWIWVWFIVAGLAVNLVGFAVKMAFAQAGFEGFGGRGLAWPVRLASFAVCGAVAGGISAVIFFRRNAPRAGTESDEP
jgi:hypothetical protein